MEETVAAHHSCGVAYWSFALLTAVVLCICSDDFRFGMDGWTAVSLAGGCSWPVKTGRSIGRHCSHPAAEKDSQGRMRSGRFNGRMKNSSGRGAGSIRFLRYSGHSSRSQLIDST
jgi:hypothetical protein